MFSSFAVSQPSITSGAGAGAGRPTSVVFHLSPRDVSSYLWEFII
jgi:hypothetical protein